MTALLAPDHGICVSQRPTTLRFQRASGQILSRDTKEFISELDQEVVSLGQFPRLRGLTRCAKNIQTIFLAGLRSSNEIPQPRFDEGLTAATVQSIALECVACFDIAQALGGELPLAAALHFCCVTSNYFRVAGGGVRALSVFTDICKPWRFLKMSLQLFAMKVNAQGGCTPAFVDALTALGGAVTAATDATALAPLVDDLKRECFVAKRAKMYKWLKELTEVRLPRSLAGGSDRELDLITRGILNNLGQPHGAFNLK